MPLIGMRVLILLALFDFGRFPLGGSDRHPEANAEWFSGSPLIIHTEGEEEPMPKDSFSLFISLYRNRSLSSIELETRERTGMTVSFDRNGALRAVYTRRNAVLCGPCFVFNKKGRLAAYGFYKEGKPWSGVFMIMSIRGKPIFSSITGTPALYFPFKYKRGVSIGQIVPRREPLSDFERW